MKTAKEFQIEAFESKYPEVIEQINKWEVICIKRGLLYLEVPLNRTFIHNVPESKWDEKLRANAEWYWYQQFGKQISEYLINKGYKKVMYGEYLNIPVETSHNKCYSGFGIRAYTQNDNEIIKELK